MTIRFTLNKRPCVLDIDPETPLLWALRDHLHLTGTKFGCGIAQCGACTVHLEGQPIRSCVTPVSAVAGQALTTIEGLAESAMGATGKAVQAAWEDLSVVQCGYCQSGQIMSASALLASNADPSDQDIDDYMSGNICRCATYVRIKKAIKQAAGTGVSAPNNAEEKA